MIQLFLAIHLLFGIVFGIFAQSEFIIGFGSCLDQEINTDILNQITAQKPNLFIFMGDNIYKDSENPEEKKPAYEKMKNDPNFQKLKKQSKLLYIWDDHDYGVNDSGADYEKKELSKTIFLDAFEEPINSERRKRNGVYDSYTFPYAQKTIQVILLDTRTFRSDLKKSNLALFGKTGYVPDFDPKMTILGEEQWNWFENQLKVKADLRLIVSSIQFYNDYHKFEKWGNFPLERQKLLDILKKNQTKGAILLSGDRHIGEFHLIKEPGLPPLYEITSSPLNRELKFQVKEPYHPARVGNFFQDSNFGILRLKMESGKLFISMELHLKQGFIFQKKISIDELNSNLPE